MVGLLILPMVEADGFGADNPRWFSCWASLSPAVFGAGRDILRDRPKEAGQSSLSSPPRYRDGAVHLPGLWKGMKQERRERNHLIHYGSCSVRSPATRHHGAAGAALCFTSREAWRRAGDLNGQKGRAAFVATTPVQRLAQLSPDSH